MLFKNSPLPFFQLSNTFVMRKIIDFLDRFWFIIFNALMVVVAILYLKFS
jgi:hypothetical protein